MHRNSRHIAEHPSHSEKPNHAPPHRGRGDGGAPAAPAAALTPPDALAAVSESVSNVKFEELALAPELLEALAKLKFVMPTPIQAALIPVALEGRDCLGQAKTGTGKTAAFSLPMLQRTQVGGGLQSLVLVPTRELARQVQEHVRSLGAKKPLKTALVYGGQRIDIQLRQLRDNPEIVVGTPGRVLDLMRRGSLSLTSVRLAVLDEVDRMLDIGFRDDIRRILRNLPEGHQTIFVSATIDDEIRRLAKSFMRDPAEVNVSRDALTVESIEQGFVSVGPHDKTATLMGFLKHEAPSLAIVFTNTKHAARRVGKRLKDAGVKCMEIHGDLIQRRREKVMDSFRKAHIQVLVATDLASRGIDVMEVSHIINYDLPPDPAVYVHRVGRTARMGRAGYAVSFVTPEEGKELTAIEMHINKELPRIEADWIVRRPEPTDHHGPPRSEHGKRGRDGDGSPASRGGRAQAGERNGEVAVEAGPVQAPGADSGESTSRLQTALRRDEVLESLGLRPVRRTLGSRFRSARRLRR